MRFIVEWSCDDEFCRERHGPSEIEAETEEQAIEIVEKDRADRELLGCSMLPRCLKYEKVLWQKPVSKS